MFLCLQIGRHMTTQTGRMARHNVNLFHVDDDILRTGRQTPGKRGLLTRLKSRRLVPKKQMASVRPEV